MHALWCFEVEARANVHEEMHARARAATDAYHEARRHVARFLGAASEQEVVFTYGTTSSINLLAYSFGALLSPGDEILLSTLEHHSNLVPWHKLAERRGVVLRFLPATPPMDDSISISCARNSPAGVGSLPLHIAQM